MQTYEGKLKFNLMSLGSVIQRVGSLILGGLVFFYLFNEGYVGTNSSKKAYGTIGENYVNGILGFY